MENYSIYQPSSSRIVRRSTSKYMFKWVESTLQYCWFLKAFQPPKKNHEPLDSGCIVSWREVHQWDRLRDKSDKYEPVYTDWFIKMPGQI